MLFKPLSTLTADQSIGVNSQLISNNGKYQLILQGDGNLVLYRLADHHPLWATATNGKIAVSAIMQGDGNFVLYDALHKPLWASGTNGKNGTYLIMQDDGNLVIYQNAKAVWASSTNQ